MKNNEVIELLKKYKTAIQKGFIKVEDILNCSDEEMKIYQNIDIESLVKYFDANKEHIPLEETFKFFKYLSLDEIKNHESDMEDYLSFINIVSSLPKETGIYSLSILNSIFDILVWAPSKELGYRTDHINALKEIIENSDDISLKREKLYYLKEFLHTSYSKDGTFGYSTHHLDDIKALVEAKDAVNVYDLSRFYLRSYNFDGKNGEKYSIARNLIKDADPKICSLLVELATNENLVEQEKNIIAMLIFSLYPERYLFDVATNEVALSTSLENYISDLVTIGKVGLNEEYSKMSYLCTVATSPTSLSSAHHLSDMKLISESNDNSVISALASLAMSKKSLKSPHHNADMTLIKSLGDSSEDVNKWKISTLLDIANSEDSLNSPNHTDDMKYVYDLELSDDMDYSDLKLWAVATSPSSLNSPYHRYNMEFLMEHGYSDFAALYTNSNSLNSKYHHYNLEVLKNFSSINEKDRNNLIALLTDKESLESSSHISNVLTFLKRMEVENGVVDSIISELSENPEVQFNEPAKILQKVRTIPDKKVES